MALILYDRGIRRAKEMQGRPHSHYTTAGVVTHPETLDAVIREIEGGDPGFNALTWLEINLGRHLDEERGRLHADLREKTARIRELEQELARRPPPP